MDLRWNFKGDNPDRPQLPPISKPVKPPTPSAPVKSNRWLPWLPWTKEAPRPRIFYATLRFAKMPFPEGNAAHETPERRGFSFRISDAVGALSFRTSFTNNGVCYIRRNNVNNLVYYQLNVYEYSNYDYTYTGILTISPMEETSPFRYNSIQVSFGPHWLRTGEVSTDDVSKGIALLFVLHPKVYKFLFDAEHSK